MAFSLQYEIVFANQLLSFDSIHRSLRLNASAKTFFLTNSFYIRKRERRFSFFLIPLYYLTVNIFTYYGGFIKKAKRFVM